MIQDLEQRFNGLYTPSAGHGLPAPGQARGGGLVERADEGRKATYRLTDAGRAEVAARRGDLEDCATTLDRTVRDLAEEVRDRVSGTAADLRAELRAAAREARATARPVGGTAEAPYGGWGGWGGARTERRPRARALGVPRGGARRVAQAGLSPEQVGEIAGILTEAGRRIREVVAATSAREALVGSPGEAPNRTLATLDPDLDPAPRLPRGTPWWRGSSPRGCRREPGPVGRGPRAATAHHGLPWATLLVNVTGSLALGLLLGLRESRRAHPLWRPALGTGVLGGFHDVLHAHVGRPATCWPRARGRAAVRRALPRPRLLAALTGLRLAVRRPAGRTA